MATKAKKSTSVKTAKKSTKSTATPKAKKKSAAVAKNSSVKKSTKTPPKTSTAKVSSVSKKATTKRELTPLDKIRSLHITAFIIYVILGVLTFLFVKSTVSDILYSYQDKDVFTTNAVNLVPASENLLSIDYRFYALGGLVVAALASLLLATVLRRTYEKTVTAGVPGYRWMLLGLSFAAIASFVSFVGGVHDLTALKLVAVLVLGASFLGWLSDRENQAAKTPKRVAFYGAIVAYIAALMPLAGTILGTSLFGAETFEWYVYALSAVLALSFFATLWTQSKSIRNKANLEYFAYETRYIRINQLTNFLVILILVAALQK